MRCDARSHDNDVPPPDVPLPARGVLYALAVLPAGVR